MTAALLLILVLPFIQILIQRLRRTLEERRAAAVQRASLHNPKMSKNNHDIDELVAAKNAQTEVHDFRGLS
jgi:hypothetical protein